MIFFNIFYRNTKHINMKKFKLPFILCLILLTMFSCTTLNQVNAYVMESVVVYGESQKTVSPDSAVISIVIKNHNQDMLESKDSCMDTFLNIKDLLLEQNLTNDDITIKYFNVYPTYSTTNYNLITGYNSALDCDIKINDLNKIDSVINLLTENGVDNINNVCYKISNFNEIYNEVLTDAKNLAAQKAKSILGKDDFVIKSIVEQEYYNGASLFKNLSLTNEVLNQNNNITITAKVKMEVE